MRFKRWIVYSVKTSWKMLYFFSSSAIKSAIKFTFNFRFSEPLWSGVWVFYRSEFFSRNERYVGMNFSVCPLPPPQWFSSFTCTFSIGLVQFFSTCHTVYPRQCITAFTKVRSTRVCTPSFVAYSVQLIFLRSFPTSHFERPKGCFFSASLTTRVFRDHFKKHYKRLFFYFSEMEIFFLYDRDTLVYVWCIFESTD